MEIIDIPILEPNLDRPFGHVDFFGYPFAHSCSGGRVLVKLELKSGELVLGCPLTLLVLLLLGQGTLSRRALRNVAWSLTRSSRLGRGGLAHLGAYGSSGREAGWLRSRMGAHWSIGHRVLHLERHFHRQIHFLGSLYMPGCVWLINCWVTRT